MVDQNENKMKINTQSEYQNLLGEIASDYQQGKLRALSAINTQLIDLYWNVGRRIVEFEQKGQARAEYGKALITQLAKDLSVQLGKGFSRSNLIYIRQFYLTYPQF